ncbi:hypothetical protein Tco_0761985 [Tanacetum coccineum]
MLSKKKRALRFPNYIADKPEFVGIVEKEWDVQIKGCQMYKLVEADTLTEYNEVVQEEEKFLIQQANIDWISDGDRNNKFFHTFAKLFRKVVNVEPMDCNSFTGIQKVSREDADLMIH